MTEDRSPLDLALDLLVFAPVGVFIAVTEELPQLVEKGRERLGSQMGMAKMMGEMAAPHLQQEAGKAVKSLLDRLVPSEPPHRARADAGDVASTEARPGAGAAPATVPKRPEPHPANRANGRGGTGRSSAAALAIPAYDTLSAMQVVQRLSGLSHMELEAVRDYEEGHRGRKTILNRADQLLSEAG